VWLIDDAALSVSDFAGLFWSNGVLLSDHTFMMFILAVAVVLPCMFLPRTGSFWLLGLAHVVLLVVGLACLVSSSRSFIVGRTAPAPAKFEGGFAELASFVAQVNLALFSSPFAPRAMRDMRRGTFERVFSAMVAGTVFSTAMLLIGGVFGRFMWSPGCEAWYMLDEADAGRLDVRVGKGTAVFSAVLPLPYFTHHCATLFCELVGVKDDERYRLAPRVALGVVISTGAILLGVLDSAFVSIFNAIVNVCFVLLTYGAPVAFFVRQAQHDKRARVVVGVAGAGAIACFALICAGNVVDVRDGFA
jgi:hypothetical protein